MIIFAGDYSNFSSENNMFRLTLIAMALLSGLFSFAKKDNEKVMIPEEQFALATVPSDDRPAVIVANTSLRKFKHKKLYGWTCSLVIKYKETAEKGMPTAEESEFVYNYIEELDKNIKGDPDNPNALFLARVTWNGTCEVIWQVKDPEAVHKYLGGIITGKTYPRELDYRIEHDPKWKGVAIYNKIKP